MNRTSKILVHLHLFYHEQLDYFINKLKNISGCNYDLYVTICENNETTERKILNFEPNAHIIKVKNIGYDIYPFIQILRNINLDDYDYILKLHTKNYRKKQESVGQAKIKIQGYSWRDELVDSLIGINKIFESNLNILENSKRNIGMIASKKFMFSLEDKSQENIKLLSDLKDLIGINSNYKKFCAGTMFLIRAEIVKPLLGSNIDESMFNGHIMQTGSSGKFVHAIERVFTQLTDYYGYKIYARNTNRFNFNKLLDSLFSFKKSWDNKHNVLQVLGFKFKFRIQEQLPSFSVIMPTYNRAFCIEKAINSLINQTYKNWELIIIDDGSCDNTENLLFEKYSKYFKEQRFIYKYVEHTGVSGARNKGIFLANNEWIAYLDSDNTVTSDFLESFAQAIQNNRNIKCFYAKFDKEGEIIGRPFDYKYICNHNFIDLGVFVHKKSLTKKYGKFDTELERFVDWDLIVRYTKKCKPFFIDKVLLEYNNNLELQRISTKVDNKIAIKKLKKKFKKLNFSLIKHIFSIKSDFREMNCAPQIKVGKVMTILFFKFSTYKIGMYKDLLINKFKKTYENDIAIVAIVKNEVLYIREWIEYHKLIGINKFYIYDNESEDNLKEALKEYINSGEVVYKYIEGVAQQCIAYDDAVKKYKYKNKYMAFIDIDEFIVLEDGYDLISILNTYIKNNKKCAGLAVQWCMFGSSGHIQKPNGFVIENYTMRAEQKSRTNRCIKTICNPRKVLNYAQCHVPTYYSKYVSVNADNKMIKGPYNENACWNKIRINHYYTKSLEEYKAKIARGRADLAQKRKLQEFYDIEPEINNVEDKYMLKYTNFIKNKIG